MKRKDKSCLKHKYYWVHKEEDILFNGMKAIYNILNNQDKVIMKQFYHIRCDPDLDKGFYDMLRIPCACTGCVDQPSKPWLPKLDKPYNHVMPSNPKHVSTLPYYVALINGILQN